MSTNSASKHERVVDAAIEVLASGGLRGLSHRAVDVHADVPPGTSSNYFPTRDALLHAVGWRIADDFVVRLRALLHHTMVTESRLVTEVVSWVAQAQPGVAARAKVLTILMFEMSTDSVISMEVARIVSLRHLLLTRWFVTFDPSTADFNASLVGAYVQGLLMMHHVDPDPTFDLEAAIGPFVHELLNAGSR